MKCAIVKAVTLTRLNTWSARDLLGDNGLGDAVERAKKAVQTSQARLAAAEQRLALNQAQSAALEMSGEIVPFPLRS